MDSSVDDKAPKIADMAATVVVVIGTQSKTVGAESGESPSGSIRRAEESERKD